MKRLFAPLCSLACALALAGCGMPSAILSGNTPAVSTHQVKIGGMVHGGEQAVIGSTITLWAAGTATGYGQGSTPLATTTSDSNGNFSFAAGTCTTGQLLYITAAGGNSYSSTTAPSNPYVAAMAALPQPCSANTANTYVSLNELSTVAAVWSLQQFMSISPGATPGTYGTGATTPWTIGSPSTNVIGMTNAFAQINEMVPSQYGTAGPSSAVSIINGVTYTTTIVPDTSRINTLGDILGACINSDGVTADGSLCAALMTDTTPASMTSPSDTVQAAYYLATNPAGLTMPAHGNTLGAPTYLCSAYSPGTSAPFQPNIACNTSTNIGDWNITVQWKTVTGSTTVGTVSPGAIAIDSAGNIWTGPVSSAITTNVVNQFSPTGALNITPVSSASLTPYTVNFNVAGTTTAEASTTNNAAYPLSYTRNFGIAVDTNNNAWYSSYAGISPGTLTNGTVSLTTGVVAQVTKAGVATAYLTGTVPGVIAIDGSNNVFLSNQAQGAKYSFSELVAAGSYQTLNKGVGSQGSIFNGIFVDNTGFASLLYSGTTCSPFTVYRENDAGAATAATTGYVTSGVCVYQASVDKTNNFYSSASTGNLTYTNISSSLTAPTQTTITGSTNTATTGTGGFAGLDLPAGSAIDGKGNVWVANRLSSSAAVGISEFTPNTSGTTPTFTALSEGGSVAGQFGFQGGGASAIMGVTLDGSGNVWYNTTGNSYLYHMVGAAAPVVTPIAQAVANGAIGTRP